MLQNNIRMLCTVLKVDLLFEAPDGVLTPFYDSIQDSPLMQSRTLRETLHAGTAAQTAPFLYRDAYGVFFAGLRASDGVLYMGPMSSVRLTPAKRRQFYAVYGIKTDDARELRTYTLPDIRNMILLTNSVLENAPLENEELLYLNRFISRNEQNTASDQMRFILKEEEENEDSDAYRHSYHEEQLLMQAIRDGRTGDAVRIAESMDVDVGRLSDHELNHWRNLAIVGITLCSRAAIEGGLSPQTAYRLSGYYIQKCDGAQDPAHLLHYRNRAIEDLTALVKEKREQPRSSNYVERCKDYVRKNYREKIYLEDIADSLGISPSYLSRHFKKETGVCLQDFINEERVYRAANLLIYSELSLPEIAQYVHFPSQSYFGKIFKQYKHITPRQFRDQYKAREFIDKVYQGGRYRQAGNGNEGFR